MLALEVLLASEAGGLRAIAEASLRMGNIKRIKVDKAEGVEHLQIDIDINRDKGNSTPLLQQCLTFIGQSAAQLGRPVRDVSLEWKSKIPEYPAPMTSAPCLLFFLLLLRNLFTLPRAGMPSISSVFLY